MSNFSLDQLWELTEKYLKNDIKDPNLIILCKTLYCLGAVDYELMKEKIINSKEFSITEKIEMMKNLQNEIIEWIKQTEEDAEKRKIERALKLKKSIEKSKTTDEKNC